MTTAGERLARSLLLLGAAAAASALCLLLIVPLASIALTLPPRDLLAGLRHPLVREATLVSLTTTSASLALIVALGTPLAYWLGRGSSRLRRAVTVLVQLPVVLPPAVAGLALLLAFGRRGLLGAPLGLQIAFGAGAVVMAQVFVAAPLYVQGAAAAFAALDEDQLLAARSLGTSPARLLFRVALPLARPALMASAALAWARALGEFGATLMFAGNLAGRTQTLPLAIYTALEVDPRAAQAIALGLLAVSLGLLAVLHGRARRGRR